MSKPIKILTEVIKHSIAVENQKHSIAVENLKYNISVECVSGTFPDDTDTFIPYLIPHLIP